MSAVHHKTGSTDAPCGVDAMHQGAPAMSQDKEREALLLQTVEALRNYVDVIAKAGGGDKMLFMAAMREADDKARAALAAIGPQDFGDLTGVQPCCGDYANCHRACTPRGRWQATKDREDALATQPPAVQGEPVAWQYKCFFPEDGDTEWSKWQDISEDSLPVFQRRAERLPGNYQLRPLGVIASPPSREPQWQPIESAPKDGTMFLCWVYAERYGETDDGQQYQQDASQVDFCWWRSMEDSPDGGYFDPACGQIGDRQFVSHWMPLPPPPGIHSREGGSNG